MISIPLLQNYTFLTQYNSTELGVNSTLREHCAQHSTCLLIQEHTHIHIGGTHFETTESSMNDTKEDDSKAEGKQVDSSTDFKASKDNGDGPESESKEGADPIVAAQAKDVNTEDVPIDDEEAKVMENLRRKAAVERANVELMILKRGKKVAVQYPHHKIDKEALGYSKDDWPKQVNFIRLPCVLIECSRDFK